MVFIIGDIEVHDTLVLTILILHIGKAQTTIFHAIVCLDSFLTRKSYLGWCPAISIDDREFDDITLLPIGRVEATGTEKDTQHIIYAVIVADILPMLGSIMLLTMHLYMAFSARIAIEILIYCVSLAFTSTLSEIDRCHIGTHIAKQRITKHEEIIHLLVATCH